MRITPGIFQVLSWQSAFTPPAFKDMAQKKSLLGGIMRRETETKLTDMKNIILRYFVQINIFFLLSSSLMRCYMKYKNYLSSRSKACTNGHFSAQELKLK